MMLDVFDSCPRHHLLVVGAAALASSRLRGRRAR